MDVEKALKEKINKEEEYRQKVRQDLEKKAQDAENNRANKMLDKKLEE